MSLRNILARTREITSQVTSWSNNKILGSSQSRVSAALSSGPEKPSLTPCTPNTPYVQPQFPTHGATHPAGSGIGSSQPAGGNSQGRQQLGDARGTLEMQQKILDEV